MSRIAYVNGQYVPHQEAAIHIEDRGYQFADGVYEVFTLHRGQLIGEKGHLDRLAHSLGELRIDWPVSRRALAIITREVARRNRVRDGLVYLQITRGVARRDHPFPENAESALVITARRMPPLDKEALCEGVGVITIPDIRWKRHDIKSVALLPNILGKQQAREAGAFEAWLVDDDAMVTEGTSTNAWIVTKDGDLVTHNASHAILNGITRLSVLEAAAEAGVKFIERPFSVDEARTAKEAFITSSTSHVKAVTSIDGQALGNGHVGELTSRVLDLYVDFIEGKGGPRKTDTWN
ncbi:MAG: D-amino-acid transaminase [Rhodospirillales bacterium]|nr:D-amino-acid transaminase [Rhodospirillales bacterium]